MTEAEGLRAVQARIRATAQRAGRDPALITLIAVSKTQPLARIQALIAAGHRHFGESTLQDAQTKIPAITDSGVTWHFVGHLQTNKAKPVATLCAWVHSVDSIKLAARISSAAAQADRTVNVLVQVNIASDPNQYGVMKEELYDFIESLQQQDLPGINLRGLMAIGPRGADSTGLQKAFAEMRGLAEGCGRRFGTESFQELSMGMSGDFETAIAEGATMVRVGTAIFGER